MDTITEPLLANTYPAFVLPPDGEEQLDKLRVVLTAASGDSPIRLTAYAEEERDGRLTPYIRLRLDLTAARPDPNRVYAWILTDADGQVWVMGKGRGCGCRSALKMMRPPFPLGI